MTVQRAADVAEWPTVELVQWRVMQTAAGTSHLIGCETVGFKGRVSSAIDSVNPVTGHVRTSSGREYELRGPPGFHPAAEYVWSRWCQLNQVVDSTDFTTAFVENGLSTQVIGHGATRP